MRKINFSSLNQNLASLIKPCKVFVFSSVLVLGSSFQQPLSDEEIYQKKIQQAQGSNMHEYTLNIAKGFLNRPYKAYTLESKDEEKLVVNLKEFDCSTFVESCVAMGLTYRKNDTSFDKFQYYLKRLRYYNKGQIKGYDSRIHYFSDWIYTHNQDGLLEDITHSLGGIPLKKDINFISTNWDKNPNATNTALQEKIRKVENKISNQDFYYIPKAKIRSIEDKLLNGDIIGITTNIDGLDITHEGFAIRLQDRRVYLLHASSEFKRVMVSDKPLAEYMAPKKTQTGIMVARFKIE
ncbi:MULTISPECIES: N-acetylmuramoyl-L-alanine amidase-like domain-containing protein [Arcicella]|uniref:N-acetylmuramoyl-L-alanine amidase-like domain-containing protein n=1 Tax=Arcicella lustrica TaxID=2984196 RepID=A0ABU5SJ92_9BACT|nr:N-acetylmuramoyl-L-alanine amidase-like domain-containing protein [Arcicella sp. DC25W]MEA5427353.1 N-acetylmuramoyl-L-alanine amidase-like domain-containing protein [Arcicella sp. DC25W]